MLTRCHGLSFDPAGRLYCVDVDNTRVSVYTPDGDYLYAWGVDGALPGQLNAPHGLFVDRSGDVFVSGYYGPTQKFNGRGTFLTAFGHGDPPRGPVHFHNLAGDRWGNVYVVVRTLGDVPGGPKPVVPNRISIAKYNNNGDFITAWRLSDPKHFETTCAVDRQGRVYALVTGFGEAGVETFEEE
jgi:streptogramin lyase